MARIEAACALGKIVDYIGIGPVYGTKSKPDHDPPIGLTIRLNILRKLYIPHLYLGAAVDIKQKCV